MSKKTIMKLPKDSHIQLTKNFNSSEWDCHCNRPECVETLIDLEHVVRLQKIRDIVGPLKITSGYRCEAHNTAVAGVKGSQHTKGTAADLQPRRGLPISALGELAEKIVDGVGYYDTFVHTDSRGTKVKFDRRGK